MGQANQAGTQFNYMGTDYPMVNGVVTFEGLECTGATPGELLLHSN